MNHELLLSDLVGLKSYSGHEAGVRDFAKEWFKKRSIEMVNEGVISEFTDRTPPGFDLAVYAVQGYALIDPILTDNYKLNLGNRSFTVLNTPGHTPGGICLFEEKTGLLFTSDLLYQGPLYCYAEESSAQDYYSSLKRIQGVEKDVAVIHPGHNYNHASLRLIDFAIECFDRALNNQPPDSLNSGYQEYRHPSMPRLAVRIKHP